MSGVTCQHVGNPHEPPAPTETMLVLGMCCKRQSWLASDHKVLLRHRHINIPYSNNQLLWSQVQCCQLAAASFVQERSGEEWS